MKILEFRNKSSQELKENLKQLQAERMFLRFKKAAKEFSPQRMKEVRRAIAQVKTVLTEIKLRGENV